MVKDATAKSSVYTMHHVGIVVRDIDKAIKRLESLLGVKPANIHPPPKPSINIKKPVWRGKPFEPDHKMVMVQGRDVAFEVFEPGKGESPWKEFLDSKGEGIHHLAYTVDDIDNEVAKMVKQGASLLADAKLSGGRAVYLDPGMGDFILELMQFKQ